MVAAAGRRCLYGAANGVMAAQCRVRRVRGPCRDAAPPSASNNALGENGCSATLTGVECCRNDE